MLPFVCCGLTVHVLFIVAFIVVFGDAVGFWLVVLLHVGCSV